MGSLASTLITTCLDNLAKASVSTSRSGVSNTTLAITWLNNACRAINRKHTFKELVKTYSSVTVANQKSYALPTNTRSIYDLRVIDGLSSRKLYPVIQKHFDKVVPYPEDHTTGRPTWYVESGVNVDLYPIPDAAYTMYMRVLLAPSTITASTDTVSYDSDKDDILVTYMTKEGFQHYQMYEDAGIWKKDFEDKLKYAILADDDSPDYDPVARGFDSQRAYPEVGDPWNDPFIWRLVG